MKSRSFVHRSQSAAAPTARLIAFVLVASVNIIAPLAMANDLDLEDDAPNDASTATSPRAADQNQRAAGGLDVDESAVLPALVPSDREIQAALRRALDQVPGVAPGQLAVDVHDRRARISGPVEMSRERVLALAAARRVYGVDDVVGDLRVTAPRASAAADAQLERAIRRQLFWSPYVDANEVRVEVRAGVAELSGDVGTWREREAAAENARQAGAIAVDNELFTDMRRWRPAR